MNKIIYLSMAMVAPLWLSAECRKEIPEGAQAVEPFELERYLGKWYEIARLDFKYEKGLDNTSAEYSLRDDGLVRVVNRGRKTATGKWKESIGRAKFRKNKTQAALSVSFFRPFWAGYNLIAIDSDYCYALVVGRNTNYMWLLSRETTMPEEIKEAYLQKAKQLGYNTSALIWPVHSVDN